MHRQLFIDCNGIGETALGHSTLFLFKNTNIFKDTSYAIYSGLTVAEKVAFLESNPSAQFSNPVCQKNSQHDRFSQGIGLSYYQSKRQDQYAKIVLDCFASLIQQRKLPIDVKFNNRVIHYAAFHHFSGGGVSRNEVQTLIHSHLLGMLFLPSKYIMMETMMDLVSKTFELDLHNMEYYCRLENFENILLPAIKDYYSEDEVS